MRWIEAGWQTRGYCRKHKDLEGCWACEQCVMRSRDKDFMRKHERGHPFQYEPDDDDEAFNKFMINKCKEVERAK